MPALPAQRRARPGPAVLPAALLWVLSLPVFDVISFLQPMTKGDWALGLLVVPVMTADALQLRDDLRLRAAVPRATCWSPARWGRTTIPAGRSGIPATSPRGSAAGSGPGCSARAGRRSRSCSTGCIAATIDWFDWVVFVDLIMVGVGYAQMALARLPAARQHHRGQPRHGLHGDRPDRLGLPPALPGRGARAGAGRAGVCGPCSTGCRRCGSRALAIWAFWVFLFYAAMVVDADARA